MNRRNFIRNFFVGAAGLAALGGGGIFYYVNRPEFGRKPSGERLKKFWRHRITSTAASSV